MRKPGVEMPDALQRQIRSTSFAFAEEVVAIVSRAVGAVAEQCRRNVGVPRAGLRKQSASNRPAMSASRTSFDASTLETDILTLLKKNAEGMRAEQINAVLGTSSRDLIGPIQRMLADGRMTKSGSARGTRYHSAV